MFGDESNNQLTLRLIDATGETFVKEFGDISWAGWQTVGLAVDNSWPHWSGNEDGVIDTPIVRLALQVRQSSGGARAGRLFVDEMSLTFPMADRQTLEDFESAIVRLRMTMLGAPDTTVVLGDGIDSSNQVIPFAMGRRQGVDASFAALFEPYSQSVQITSFQTLPVSPTIGSPSAFHIYAAGSFADTLMLADNTISGERVFANFSTDAAVAYLRHDDNNDLRTLVLAEATKLADGPTSLFTSTIPITLQIAYSDNLVSLTVPVMSDTQLWVYGIADARVLVNGIPTPTQRDGHYIVLSLPPDPFSIYLPVAVKD